MMGKKQRGISQEALIISAEEENAENEEKKNKK